MLWKHSLAALFRHTSVTGEAIKPWKAWKSWVGNVFTKQCRWVPCGWQLQRCHLHLSSSLIYQGSFEHLSLSSSIQRLSFCTRHTWLKASRSLEITRLNTTVFGGRPGPAKWCFAALMILVHGKQSVVCSKLLPRLVECRCHPFAIGKESVDV